MNIEINHLFDKSAAWATPAIPWTRDPRHRGSESPCHAGTQVLGDPEAGGMCVA
jgi:hypothetical protein